MKQEEKIEIRDIQKKEQFVLDDANYDGYAKIFGAYASLVYVALCRYADFLRQTCFPSISLTAEQLGISGKQVMRALQVLEDHNIIRREKTHGRSNRYWLIDKKHWKPAGVSQAPVTTSHPCQTGTSDYQSPVPVTDSHTKDSHIRIHTKDFIYTPKRKPENIPYEEIILYLNRRTGLSYKHEWVDDCERFHCQPRFLFFFHKCHLSTLFLLNDIRGLKSDNVAKITIIEADIVTNKQTLLFISSKFADNESDKETSPCRGESLWEYHSESRIPLSGLLPPLLYILVSDKRIKQDG